MIRRKDVAAAGRMPALPYTMVLALTALWCSLYVPQGGMSEGVLLELTRLTARTSVFFFLAAFSASALLKLTRSGAARFLVINRRHIGLSFALSHFIHLGALLSYFAVSGEEPGAVAIYAGGFAYLLILLMAATSNDVSQRRLGLNWRRLHLIGSWYVWAVFLNSYLGRVLEGREPLWMFGGITALLLSAAILRLVIGARERLTGRALG
jgi:sulfoxide reductase heme-binding subunit YedZ